MVAFGRLVQGCSSRSEAHVAGQDLTTLLGLKYMHDLLCGSSSTAAAAAAAEASEFFLWTDQSELQNTAGRCPPARQKARPGARVLLVWVSRGRGQIGGG